MTTPDTRCALAHPYDDEQPEASHHAIHQRGSLPMLALCEVHARMYKRDAAWAVFEIHVPDDPFARFDNEGHSSQPSDAIGGQSPWGPR